MALLPLAVRVDPKYQQFSIPTDGPSMTWRRRVKFNDFSAAAVTGDLDLKFPGGVQIVGCGITLITFFQGGAAATSTLSIGSTGTPALYLTAQDVFTTSVLGTFTPSTVTVVPQGVFISGNATPTVVGTVRFRLTTTAANTNVLTAGVADVWLMLRALSVKLT